MGVKKIQKVEINHFGLILKNLMYYFIKTINDFDDIEKLIFFFKREANHIFELKKFSKLLNTYSGSRPLKVKLIGF
jgi:hypothetical protein